MTYDLVVAGGGAAGLTAAIALKRRRPQASVLVLEALDRVGKKLITTGNGRCNITNSKASIARYHGRDPALAEAVFRRYFVPETVDFFKSLGVEIVFEEDGRAYPASYQAAGVVDALRFAAQEEGVEIRCDCRLLDFGRAQDLKLQTSQGPLSAKSLLLAGGLLSGGPKAGSDGSLLMLLKMKGFRTVKTNPAIVQLRTDTSLTRQLKGIKWNANCSICREGKALRTEFGEVLFTEYGLSGPPILQISRFASAPGPWEVRLDLFPAYSLKALTTALFERRQLLAKRPAEHFLAGLIHKRIGLVLIKEQGISLAAPAGEIEDEQLKALAARLKALPFTGTGTAGYLNSQVTAGGLAAEELRYEDLQLRRIKGVFAAGELLDIDGDCGGFNLQWAWSTGLLAAEGVDHYLGEK